MKKKKVMIVDDEQDFLYLTKLNLERTGQYSVLTLLSAQDIVAQVHSFKPDIILLDILMPRIGGMEVCKILNNDPVGQKVPIVILSALDKDIDKLQAYQAGVIDFLVKPIEKAELIARVEKALSLNEMESADEEENIDY
ncbi:PleD family two-component system response regulator [Candidatus Omnitrophota bacterium]